MRISRLQLATSDLAALPAFYAGVLGLPVAPAADATTVQVGGTRVDFVAVAGDADAHHFAINIAPDTFMSAQRYMADRVELIPAPDGSEVHEFTSWDARSLYFLDPVGNVVELIARQDLPERGDPRFSVDAVIAVSEIGVVVDDMRAAVTRLCERFDAPLYDGGGPAFAAIGDPHGLLIVVPRAREWYPDSGVVSGEAEVLVGVDGAEPADLRAH